MRISILDSSPIAKGRTAKDALQDSLKLAQAGERIGCHRYWMTEHHDLNGLASSTPEVVLSYIGAYTETIRLGTGAILLPHYKPFKVAEVHHTLATLFPDRIDIGIGRAPGGSAEVTNALNDNFLQQVYKMPELVRELLAILDGKAEKLKASPVPSVKPVPWLLGTSAKSASLAAENGTAYAFGQWMSETDGMPVIEEYEQTFVPRNEGDQPASLMTIGAICADTNREALRLAKSLSLWQLHVDAGFGEEGIPAPEEADDYVFNEEEGEKFERFTQKTFIGDADSVVARIKALKVDEVMIHTPAHRVEDRIQSYALITERMR